MDFQVLALSSTHNTYHCRLHSKKYYKEDWATVRHNKHGPNVLNRADKPSHSPWQAFHPKSDHLNTYHHLQFHFLSLFWNHHPRLHLRPFVQVIHRPRIQCLLRCLKGLCFRRLGNLFHRVFFIREFSLPFFLLFWCALWFFN